MPILSGKVYVYSTTVHKTFWLNNKTVMQNNISCEFQSCIINNKLFPRVLLRLFLCPCNSLVEWVLPTFNTYFIQSLYIFKDNIQILNGVPSHFSNKIIIILTAIIIHLNSSIKIHLWYKDLLTTFKISRNN